MALMHAENANYGAHNAIFPVVLLLQIPCVQTSTQQFVLNSLLTLRLLMSYIYGAPSKARNANVVYIWTYVWQR